MLASKLSYTDHLVYSILLNILLALFAWRLLVRGNATREQIGLLPPSSRQVLYALAWGLAQIPLLALFQNALTSFFSTLQKVPAFAPYAQQQLQLFARIAHLSLRLPLLSLILTLLIALPAQLLFFQAWLYRSLRRTHGVWASCLLVACFAGALALLIHFSLIQAALSALFILLITLLYERIGSLWGTWIAGGLFSLLATLLHFVSKSGSNYTIGLFTQVVFELLLFALGVWLIRRRNLTLQQAGFRPPTPSELLFIAPWLGIGVFVMGSVIGRVQQELLTALFPHASWLLHNQGLAEHIFRQLHGWQRFGFVIIGAVLAPVAEETLFRGGIYASLRNRLGIGWGLTISSLLFAIAHLDPLEFVPIFFIGMALALVYEKTRSLWMSMIVHGTNNAMAFFLISVLQTVHR
ncbi:MAG TPA: CPBP family intramembrane glutamic endopeptidase [Chthonomonas sp.]|uniref:CPBP family intramembrane glutamic endopeptidase n=1 Tax=Chthonomonas sp. TaxID=2282153 RepID=UPI002B4ACA10|nr:CPBP family intramembrane glutamic endopeptidase [Chthonomonas sp.]HLI48336.1 CPBP family intramembrane glutamic endopeptidase [Chthonomonas sp.]